MFFAGLTLQWPWDALRVILEWYPSKAQHQPLAKFLPDSVSICCHGSPSWSSTLLHFSWFFSFIPALGKGCDKRNTKGYLPQPGWKWPKNHRGACRNGTRERMCEQKLFLILSCTPHQFKIDKSKTNYVFIPIWPWNDLNLTKMWPWSCTPLNHNIITCHYLLLVWDPAGVLRNIGQYKIPSIFSLHLPGIWRLG